MPRDDITAFWQQTREDLDKTPSEAQVEPAPEQSGREYLTSRVVLTSYGGVRIRAWLTVPQEPPPARGLPAVVALPGYGGDKPVPVMLAQLGFAVLTLYPRGQGESRSEWEVPAGDTKLTHNLEDRDRYYYRGAYMDLVRGVDFLCARQEVHAARIGAWGRSQGGGLSLALAALDHRLAACVGEQPFLANFPVAASLTTSRPYAELNTYLAQHPDLRETILAHLACFDTLNLADAIACPTLVNTGLKDTTCPPETVLPVFERLRCMKGLLVYPDLGHDPCADFTSQAVAWLRRYLA